MSTPPAAQVTHHHERYRALRRTPRCWRNLLRLESLPESWIGPRSIRELRELVGYRHKLSQLRPGLKSQVHAVLGKEGVLPQLRELWGPARFAYLNEIRLGDAYEIRLESLQDLIEVYDREITELDGRIQRRLRNDVGYRVIQQLTGIGRVHAAALAAEIGDVTRFPHAKQLCSWAGLTPQVRKSDTTSHHGSITKQGSRLVRWSVIEAVTRYHGGAPIRDTYRRVAERCGTSSWAVRGQRCVGCVVRSRQLRSTRPSFRAEAPDSPGA